MVDASDPPDPPDAPSTNDTPDSFLARRRAALLAGERAVPLDYERLRERAREHLPRGPYAYAAGGAGTEDTMRANREAFRRYRIVTRVLRDVSERDLRVDLFGREVAAPLVLAPIGSQQIYHEEGELATARAAADLDVPMALSTGASRSIEDVAAANGDGMRLFQLYWPADWEVAASLVERAEAAGYDGIVLTVDSQLPKWRRRNLRNAYSTRDDAPKAIFESDPVVRDRAEAAGQPLREYIDSATGLGKDTSLTWEDLDALRRWTDLPVVLKGILAPEDARRAAEWGAEGVVVSTHGGRQIDGEVGALAQLPAVVEAVEAVGADTTVLLDSGIRGGADAFKALALGADAVLLGRPYVFGLTIAGQRGVRETVENYLAELESVVGLSGHAAIDEVDRGALVERDRVRRR